MTKGRVINVVASAGAELVRAREAFERCPGLALNRLEIIAAYATAEQRYNAARELARIVNCYPELFE